MKNSSTSPRTFVETTRTMPITRLAWPLLVVSCAALVVTRPIAQTAAPAPTTERKPGEYPLGPDSLPQTGVPKGRLEGPTLFHSKIIEAPRGPNSIGPVYTTRKYWV